ncbi:homeotic protein caudal-like isoform X3 [Tenebrio molitor]|jgi:homeobox protein CDX|uniref:homeotic protein caudal-like isoform X3 n=1 Tax=Tenebrio molitor TaxID=7067 RepID=UPI003624A18C
MVSYYNSTNMYRHQQAVTTPANASMHSWYTAGYHQTGQMAPEQQMWEQQIWHHHPHVSSHSVFANNEYPEFVHSGMVHNDGGHGQLMPSPTITVSGSDMSSPGAGSGNISPQNQSQVARPPPARSPYEWIKKTSYQSQPNPGKTRTKDKYRVVYTDFQRIELEKEFTFNNKYITIRRKAELAATLGLSERQIKIWFQNRRAKERKQKKRTEEKTHMENMYQHHQQTPQGQLIVGMPPPPLMMQLVTNSLKTESESETNVDRVTLLQS